MQSLPWSSHVGMPCVNMEASRLCQRRRAVSREDAGIGREEHHGIEFGVSRFLSLVIIV